MHVASSRAPVVERDDLTAPVCLAALPDVDNGNGRKLLDLQQACLNLSAHIQASEPGQIQLDLAGGFVQVFFRKDSPYARHTVDVEEKNGKIVINTWVVAD